jgi:hypothetical protein
MYKQQMLRFAQFCKVGISQGKIEIQLELGRRAFAHWEFNLLVGEHSFIPLNKFSTNIKHFATILHEDEHASYDLKMPTFTQPSMLADISRTERKQKYEVNLHFGRSAFVQSVFQVNIQPSAGGL